MRTSCLQHPENSHFVILREWMEDICDGDRCAALLMSFFESWHNARILNSEKAREANRVAENHNAAPSQDESLWQWHTSEQLKDGIRGLYSADKIRSALQLLVDKGFLEVGKNPNPRYKFDNTKFFLFHPEAVNAEQKRHNPPPDPRPEEILTSPPENRGRSQENPGPSLKNLTTIPSDTLSDTLDATGEGVGSDRRLELKTEIGGKPKSAASRPDDPLFAAFKVSYYHCPYYQINYQYKRGDMVQLANLRNLHPAEVLERLWPKALVNYFISPLTIHTLADLCVRFNVFQNHPLDKYNRPVMPEQARPRGVVL